MPRFYEEAAHLLYMITAHGAVLVPGTAHWETVKFIASLLEYLLRDRPSHADGAANLLRALMFCRLITLPPDRFARLALITGTLIGNFMTMHGRDGRR